MAAGTKSWKDRDFLLLLDLGPRIYNPVVVVDRDPYEVSLRILNISEFTHHLNRGLLLGQIHSTEESQILVFGMCFFMDTFKFSLNYPKT